MKAIVYTQVRLARRPRARGHRQAGRRGRRGAGSRSCVVREPGGVARHYGPARRADPDGAPQAEGDEAGSRLRRDRRGRRREPHGLRARRRGLRREDGRVRRVRLREERDRAEAGEHHVRAGGGRADRCAHRAPGTARQGRAPGRSEGPGQRCLGRRRHVRRPDREGVRGGGDRRVQDAERRARSLARRRPRRRLHARRTSRGAASATTSCSTSRAAARGGSTSGC